MREDEEKQRKLKIEKNRLKEVKERSLELKERLLLKLKKKNI